jgi:hypothetical protein
LKGWRIEHLCLHQSQDPLSTKQWQTASESFSSQLYFPPPIILFLLTTPRYLTHSLSIKLPTFSQTGRAFSTTTTDINGIHPLLPHLRHRLPYYPSVPNPPFLHHLTPLPVLLLTRHRWLPILSTLSFPSVSHFYTRLPTSFAGDAEAGLSSAAFDLSGNITEGDARAGLDDASKKEIQKIMRKRRLDFDEARKVYMQERFKKNNIGPDGRPRDPKFVSFS